MSSVGDGTQSITDNRHLCGLWHWRMAHLHHGTLCILREITTSVSEFNTKRYDVCKECVMGKYNKVPFLTRDNRALGILDFVHTDVSGRMSHVSLRGFEYYVVFIDDFSRKTLIFFLKTKGEVFKCFKEFKALVENHIGKKIKVLR